MGQHGKILHVRLPFHLQKKLEAIHDENFAALPLSVLVKLLLTNLMQKSESEILQTIQDQMRTPLDTGIESRSTSRIPPLNTQKHRARK